MPIDWNKTYFFQILLFCNDSKQFKKFVILNKKYESDVELSEMYWNYEDMK